MMTQPVFAAQQFTGLHHAPVITAGMGDIQGNPGPGIPGNSAAAAESVPGNAHQGNAAQGSALPGDESTVLSPVIVAGNGDHMSGAAAPGTGQNTPGMPSESAVPGPDGNAADLTDEDAVQQEAAVQSGGRYVDPARPMVALTFDDGPQPSVGNRIMDCLAQYGGKATFFMVGERVAASRTEVQRMAAEGHEVGNHTMNHKYLQKLGAAEIQAQVTRGNDAIEAACGVRPKIMRLPGGNNNATVRVNTHMPMIQWNIDTLDWKTKNADKTVAAVLNHVKDGDIILMHELYSQSGDAALRIIPELVNRGYQLVTVSEMAQAKGHALEAGKLYSAFR